MHSTLSAQASNDKPMDVFTHSPIPGMEHAGSPHAFRLLETKSHWRSLTFVHPRHPLPHQCIHLLQRWCGSSAALVSVFLLVLIRVLECFTICWVELFTPLHFMSGVMPMRLLCGVSHGSALHVFSESVCKGSLSHALSLCLSCVCVCCGRGTKCCCCFREAHVFWCIWEASVLRRRRLCMCVPTWSPNTCVLEMMVSLFL